LLLTGTIDAVVVPFGFAACAGLAAAGTAALGGVTTTRALMALTAFATVPLVIPGTTGAADTLRPRVLDAVDAAAADHEAALNVVLATGGGVGALPLDVVRGEPAGPSAAADAVGAADPIDELESVLPRLVDDEGRPLRPWWKVAFGEATADTAEPALILAITGPLPHAAGRLTVLPPRTAAGATTLPPVDALLADKPAPFEPFDDCPVLPDVAVDADAELSAIEGPVKLTICGAVFTAWTNGLLSAAGTDTESVLDCALDAVADDRPAGPALKGTEPEEVELPALSFSNGGGDAADSDPRR